MHDEILERSIHYRIDTITPSGLGKTSTAKPLPNASTLKDLESASAIVIEKISTALFMVSDYTGQAILYASPLDNNNNKDPIFIGSFSLPDTNTSSSPSYSTAILAASDCPQNLRKGDATTCVTIAQVYRDDNTDHLTCGLFLQTWALHFTTDTHRILGVTPIGKRACIEAGVYARTASVSLTPTSKGTLLLPFLFTFLIVHNRTSSRNRLLFIVRDDLCCDLVGVSFRWRGIGEQHKQAGRSRAPCGDRRGGLSFLEHTARFRPTDIRFRSAWERVLPEQRDTKQAALSCIVPAASHPDRQCAGIQLWSAVLMVSFSLPSEFLAHCLSVRKGGTHPGT